MCAEGTYFLDSACYVSRCPIGYSVDTKNRLCVVVVRGAIAMGGCNTPLYMQGTNCVTTCDPGYYPDP